MNINVFGDIGGHFAPFMEALQRLGIQIKPIVIPDNLIVVQVGDLIHRGPDSESMIEWVDTALRLYPEQWIQLLGNHEGHHVGGPEFGQPGAPEYHLSTESELKLREWRKTDMARMATSITTPYQTFLVTHAGLMRETWQLIGSPPTAQDAAEALNILPTNLAFAPGVMLGGYYQNRHGARLPPGPSWASAGEEVYPSWRSHVSEIPFSQVHGHSTIFNWNSKKFYVDKSISNNVHLDSEKRFTTWWPDGPSPGKFSFHAIDQALGRYSPSFKVQPLLFNGKIG